MQQESNLTPKELGYYFPAEFAPQAATWLSWPHKEASWPGKIHTIFPYYAQFIKELAKGQKVNINVNDEAMQHQAMQWLEKEKCGIDHISFFIHDSSDIV